MSKVIILILIQLSLYNFSSGQCITPTLVFHDEMEFNRKNTLKIMYPVKFVIYLPVNEFAEFEIFINKKKTSTFIKRTSAEHPKQLAVSFNYFLPLFSKITIKSSNGKIVNFKYYRRYVNATLSEYQGSWYLGYKKSIIIYQ